MLSKTLIVTIIFNATTIWNYTALTKFFKALEKSLSSSLEINLASSSINRLIGLTYEHYLQAASDSSYDLSIATSEDYLQLLKNIENFTQLEDEYLFNIMINEKMCDVVLKGIGEGEGYQDCEYIVIGDTNFTMYKGVHKLIERYHSFSREVKAEDSAGFKRFFESEELLRFDLLGFYQALVMRLTSGEYMDKILGDIQSTSRLSAILSGIFFAFIGLFLIVFKTWWLPKQVRMWKDLENVLLVLNDDMINNMYLKSFFIGNSNNINN